MLAVVVNFAAAVGKLAFESIVQRDAPQANRGRAFARFETRFQLAWAVAGLIPVVIVIPGWVGFLVVGVVIGARVGPQLRRRHARLGVPAAHQRRPCRGPARRGGRRPRRPLPAAPPRRPAQRAVTGRRQPATLPAICRVEALIRFQAFVAAIVMTRAASPASSKWRAASSHTSSGTGIAAVAEAGDGLGEGEGGALGVVEARCLAPGRDADDALDRLAGTAACCGRRGRRTRRTG